MISVRSVDVYRANIPLRKPFRIATMVTTDAELVFVRIVDSSGLVGWGEAAPLRSINGETQATCLAACYDLAGFLVGQLFESAASAVALMESILAGQATARSALDMALFDIESQAAGVSLVELLGGKARRMPTDLTIPIVPASEANELAAEIVAAGYKSVKVKLGDGIGNDFVRVKAVRSAAPEARVRVDANQAYDARTALDLLNLLSDLDIEFCEQPVKRHDHEGLGRLHATSPVPVMADESVFTSRDAEALLKGKRCDLLNIKLSKSGGLAEGLRIAETARAHQARCMHGGMVETRLGTTAAGHLASSSDVFHWFDLDSFHSHRDDPVIGGMVHDQGDAVLPSGPGLGATIDPAFLAQCEKRTVGQ